VLGIKIYFVFPMPQSIAFPRQTQWLLIDFNLLPLRGQYRICTDFPFTLSTMPTST